VQGDDGSTDATRSEHEKKKRPKTPRRKEEKESGHQDGSQVIQQNKIKNFN